MKRITVNVSKKYDILLGNCLINSVSNFIKEVAKSSRVAVITDNIVNNLYGTKLVYDLKSAGFETFKFVFKNGESSKNINTFVDILEFLAENSFKRNDLLIALGGGVVGDITGFSAATYMRGINFVQIPTTLLAMVDASVGGKTAIDLKHGKNLAGTFWQPSLVICDCCLIRSLPDDIFAEGMAEVIKCGAIREKNIIDNILAGKTKENINQIVEACIMLKRDVVEADEFETKGIRQILNVGHTVAHSLEKLSNYQISHGRAVGTGLVVEAKIAEAKSLLNDQTSLLLKKAVEQYHLYEPITYDLDLLVNAMKADKKNLDNKISFMLPTKLGDYHEVKLEVADVANILKEMQVNQS